MAEVKKITSRFIIFPNDLLREKGLERSDDSSQIRLVFVVIVEPLSIQHIVHRRQVVLLR